jgi:putative sterol carrier protein
MAIFSDTGQFYTCTRAVFARMAEQDPAAGQSVARTRMILRLSVTEPAGQITLDGRREPIETYFGPTSLRPDLEIAMSSITLHRILTGQLSVLSALSAGLLKVRGPVLRALALSDVFHHMQRVYPEVLREQGLG